MSEYLAPIAYRVPADDEGLTVHAILRQRLKLSRTLVARLKMTECGIMLNGRRVYTSAPVIAGDLVEARMERESSDDILPEPLRIDVLYEDEYLLIVNKAAGMIVHPTHGHYTGTLANGVVHYWQARGERVRFRPIHRLDQFTSGVLAIAKNPYVHQHVSEQMKRWTVDKSYIAFVHGAPEPEAGTIDAPIDRDRDNPHVRVVTADGYAARTAYTTVRRYASCSAAAVRLRLETGRTHQIRVHMKHIGCPLIGDPMYGPGQPSDDERLVHGLLDRQALHAERLAFVHPASGERVCYDAPLPDDLAELRNYLERSDVKKGERR